MANEPPVQRPPYAVPLMATINAHKGYSGLTAASTFSGCGGNSTGLKWAGFDVRYASEFVPAAQETYRANHPGTFLDDRDIRLTQPEDVLNAAGLKAGELDLLDGSPPCFPGSTLVVTRIGYRPIKDVQVGDLVLTHEGAWRPVTELSERRYRGPLVVVQAKYGRDPVFSTPEHPYFVRRRLDGRLRAFSEPEWVAAKDVRPGDLVLEPFVRESYQPEFDPVPMRASRGSKPFVRPVSLDHRDVRLAWVLGLYVAAGHLRGSDQPVHGPSRRVMISSIHRDEVPEAAKRIAAAGFAPGVVEQAAHCHRIEVASLDLWSMCRVFGSGAHDKVVPEWVHGMPAGWQSAFLDGYRYGDGHARLNGWSAAAKVAQASSVSKLLILGLVRVIARVHQTASATSKCADERSCVVEGRTVHAADQWWVRFCRNTGGLRSRPFEVDDRGCWLPVIGVSITDPVDDLVYNMGVDDHSTYVAGGFAVHNCKSFSTSGKRDRGWGDVSHYCIAPDARVLTADLRWVPAGEVAAGQAVVAFDEVAEGASRKFRPATVFGVDRVRYPSKRITLSDGAVVVASNQHRWLAQRGGHDDMRWFATSALRVGDRLRSIGRPWGAPRTYEAGWLSGLFDGEGAVCAHGPESPQNRTLTVQVSQPPGPVLDRAMAAMTELGIQFGCHPNRESGVVSLTVSGGLGAKLRALGMLRPTRLLPRAACLWDGLSIEAAEEVTVVGIEDVGEVELVAFSTSARTFIAEGLLSHNSDGIYQRTDDLFFEYVRLLGGIRPKVFIAENVTGLVKGSAVGYFKEVLAAMQGHGYRVKACLLNGAWCGVPQARERILYVGVRKDLGKDPSFPKPLPYVYTVRDGWAGLKNTDKDVAECVHLQPGHFLHTAWHMTMPGDNFIPAAQRMKGKASYFDYRRLGWHLPAPTIKATPGGLYHPDVPRSCTIPELRRLSGLPDDFILTGTYEQRWERCGRLVPPPMYHHLARHIRDVIFGWKGRLPKHAR